MGSGRVAHAARSHLDFAAFWADFLWTAVRESRLAAQNELFVRRKVIFQQRQPHKFYEKS